MDALIELAGVEKVYGHDKLEYPPRSASRSVVVAGEPSAIVGPSAHCRGTDQSRHVRCPNLWMSNLPSLEARGV
jgi:hypothetical protein